MYPPRPNKYKPRSDEEVNPIDILHFFGPTNFWAKKLCADGRF